MLTKMKLGNFKSWRELDIDLAPITLLFGTNSSGKTSILHALLLLKQTANSFDRGQHINFGGSERDYVDFGSYRDLVFNHELNKSISMQLEWPYQMRLPFMLKREDETEIMPQKFSYCVEWSLDNDQVLIHKVDFKTILTNQKTVSLNAERSSGNYRIHIKEDNDREVFGLSPLLSMYEVYLSGLELTPESNAKLARYSRDFEDLLSAIVYLGPLRQSPQRNYLWTSSVPQAIEPSGKNAVEAIIASVRQRSENSDLLEHVEHWLVELGLVSEFRVEPIDRDRRYYETRIKIGVETHGSSLVDVGFGISQVLPVLTMLFFVPEGSTVLIEQPELHLHPSAQARLGDLFLQVAETRHLQLIIESHSEHLLRRFQRRIAEPQWEFATPENIKAYFCKAGEQGSEIQPVEVDEYGQIRNWPENFFGDLGGDLDAMMDAALERRREELSQSG